MRPSSPGPLLLARSSSSRPSSKDRYHLGYYYCSRVLQLLVILLALLVLPLGATAAATGTSAPSAAPPPSTTTRHHRGRPPMSSETPLPTPPTPTPAPPASSAAAQARLLELDRLCERLAQRLRKAEDRLYGHGPASVPAQAPARMGDGDGDGTCEVKQHRPPRVVFSDLDGTLLHFGGTLLEEGYEVLTHNEELPAGFEPLGPPVIRAHDPEAAAPPQYVVLRYKPDGTRRVCIALPSLTSGPGYISVATLRLVHAIRTLGGCDFVLITGARSSTYLMRRRIGLPVADYEVIEGGGRLVRDPDGKLDTLLAQAGKGGHDAADEHGYAWDAHWREAIGPVTALRALRAELEGAGWSVDGRDYLTNFRLDTRANGKSPGEWEALKARLPSLGLASSFNLGKADIYPATSGKAPAVSRLMRRLHADPQECVALFDDDNDLGMAQLCKPGRRVAVSITHDSVRQLVASDPRVETGGPRPGILATEEALRRVLASLLMGGDEAAARVMADWVV